MIEQIELFKQSPKTKVVHCKKSKFDIYIGRPSIWGNPFSHKINTLAEFKVDSIKEAVEKYREWVLGQPEILKKIPELKGKILGCWCKDKNGNGLCHGDVLAELADRI